MGLMMTAAVYLPSRLHTRELPRYEFLPHRTIFPYLLPEAILKQVYHDNAARLLGLDPL